MALQAAMRRLTFDRQFGEAGMGRAAGAVDSDLYEYRPPIDLANPRLRMLAAALAPASVAGRWQLTVEAALRGRNATGQHHPTLRLWRCDQPRALAVQRTPR